MVLDDYIENDNIFNKVLESIEQERKVLENRKNELKKVQHKILEEKILQFIEFSKYSTFDINIIGNKIADLLTNIKGENYKYITCVINARKYSGYDYVSKQKEYVLKEIPVHIIVPLEKSLLFDGNVDIEDFRKLIIDNYVIVIDRNEYNKSSEKINFYDNDFNFNLNRSFENEDAIHYFDMPNIDEFDYALIKYYVDKVINYRMKDDTLELDNNKELVEESLIDNEKIRPCQLINSVIIENVRNEKILKKEKR